jgi:hypothetical protein
MTLENELFEAFDRVVHQDHPNPQRINCPGSSTLRALAAEPGAVDSASMLVHIRQCAPCFDELRELRRRQPLRHP